MRFEHHIFVCTNERPPGAPLGSCCEKGSAVVFARLKAAVEARGLGYRVRVNQAGCLSACGLGPTVVVYPEGIWYGRVRPEDAERIVAEHIVKGKPVEDIRIPAETWVAPDDEAVETPEANTSPGEDDVANADRAESAGGES